MSVTGSELTDAKSSPTASQARGCRMDRSTGRNPVKSVSTNEVAAPDLILGQMPTIDFFPADVVRHRTARWRGVRAKTMQIINHEPVEYRFKQKYHLLIAVEQGVCYEAETFIEGLPIST